FIYRSKGGINTHCSTIDQPPLGDTTGNAMSQPHDANARLLHELQSEFGSLSARMQTENARCAVAGLAHVGTDPPDERPAPLSTIPTITVIAGTNGAGKSSI